MSKTITLTTLHRADDVFSRLQNAYRALDSNGQLTIAYPNPLHSVSRASCPNWLPPETMDTLLTHAGFSVEKFGWFFGVPRSKLTERFSHTPLARLISPTLYFRVRKVSKPEKKTYRVSVIIPCKDEEGNIAKAVRSVPQLGAHTEIIVVDDGSNDGTAAIVERLKYKVQRLKLISYQPNRGKSHAVAAGFKRATGDIVMIWDADMTVPAQELGRFIEPLERGYATFTNGARFMYPMEKKAMRPLNFVGNKLMSVLFSWVLGQHVTDTLCGTKALLKKDWQKIPMNLDPWGDFSLLIGASKNGLKIMDVPVHYKARVAGTSKMKTFQHGLWLLKAAVKGTILLKLKYQSSNFSGEA